MKTLWQKEKLLFLKKVVCKRVRKCLYMVEATDEVLTLYVDKVSRTTLLVRLTSPVVASMVKKDGAVSSPIMEYVNVLNGACNSYKKKN